jgi:hypothetical protein
MEATKIQNGEIILTKPERIKLNPGMIEFDNLGNGVRDYFADYTLNKSYDIIALKETIGDEERENDAELILKAIEINRILKEIHTTP